MSEKRVTREITRRKENSVNDKLFAESNKVLVSGIIEEEFEYSYKFLSEKFYRTRVRVTRLSGIDDLVPIVVSNSQIDSLINNAGKWIEVEGQFRSFTKLGDDGRRHLDLYLFATSVNVYENEAELKGVNENYIYLDGYICKPPVFRTTPSGRQITDIFIAVNRGFYDKSDYIPCITWGRAAQWAGGLEVGNRIKIYGRVQSRKYFKRYSPETEEGEYKEAYEISVKKIEKVLD